MTKANHSARVVLIGAGAISEHHALALARVPNARLIGFVDRDSERARLRAERFGVKTYASIADAAADGANVAHILVPPAAHAAVALECIAHGMHVLVEKPLATSVADCEAIGRAAREKGVVATVGHSLLFDPELATARRLIGAGAIGEIVSVDYIRSSEYPSYSGGPRPPHYANPGEPFRDLGVHAVYVLQSLLGEIRSAAPLFRSLGGDPLLAYDEWSCTFDHERGFGTVRLSWNVRPIQSLLIVQGTAGVMRVDLFHMFVSLRRTRPMPKAALRIFNTLTDSLRPLFEMPKNTLLFMLKRRRQYQGIHSFVADFYARLARGDGPAITVADGTAAVRWTQAVASAAEQAFVPWNDRHPVGSSCDVLVTGGSGKLGSATVDALLAQGKRVRVLARRPPSLPLREGLEYVVGDLGDPNDVDRAMRGAASVVHAGAAMTGDWNRFYGATVVGTQNVIAAAERFGVRRVVHVSSLSVVDWAGSDGRSGIDESAPYEPCAELRGSYTRAKLESERLVVAAAQAGKINAVILRPGQIFGRRQPVLTAAVCRKVGPVNLVLGDGRLQLPLVYVDDVVAAIVKALEVEVANGTVVQLVDPARLTQNDVLRICKPGGATIRLPRPLVFALGRLSEVALGMLGRQSPLGVYRLRSGLARIDFRSEAARRILGWEPAVGVETRLAEATASAPQGLSTVP
jgi:predicted dehydrogenase/nucleoside-diphosphate-sugar epimerase